jgi:hypothetical protein
LHQVAFQTTNQQDYISIKEQLKKLGFKYLDAGTTNDNGSGLSYKKGLIEVYLISFQSESSRHKKTTGYQITVKK